MDINKSLMDAYQSVHLREFYDSDAVDYGQMGRPKTSPKKRTSNKVTPVNGSGGGGQKNKNLMTPADRKLSDSGLNDLMSGSKSFSQTMSDKVKSLTPKKPGDVTNSSTGATATLSSTPPKPLTPTSPTSQPVSPAPASAQPIKPATPAPQQSTPTNDSGSTPINSKPPVKTPSAVPAMSGTMGGSKPSSPFKSSRLNSALTGIQAGSWKNKSSLNTTTKSESYMDSQRYHSMGDAYRDMYEAKGYQEGGEVDKDDDKGGKGGMFAFRRAVLPQPSVTKVNIDVNPQQSKVGEVEKAYYAYPAGFDPTNREDITRKGTTNEDVEITEDEFFDFMVESGIAGDVNSASLMYDHMTEAWVSNIVEGLKQARKNVGMDPNKPSCWKGYKASGTKMKGGKSVPDCKKA